MFDTIRNAIEDRILVALGIILWVILEVLAALLWALQYLPRVLGTLPLIGWALSWLLGGLGRPALALFDRVQWITPWVIGLWSRPAAIGAVLEAVLAAVADVAVYFGYYRAGANKERHPLGTTHISDAVWGVLAGLYWAYRQALDHRIAFAILGGSLLAGIGVAIFLIRRRRP